MLLFLIVSVATTANAQSVTIQNPSFETAVLSFTSVNGASSNILVGSTAGPVSGTLQNWTAASTTTNASAGGFSPSPGGSNWTPAWWLGANIAYLQLESSGTVSLSQVLPVTLQNNTSYMLNHPRFHDDNRKPTPPIRGVPAGAQARYAGWHFTNRPFTTDGAATVPPKTHNIVTKLKDFASIGDMSVEQQADLVPWVLHLIGNVHQPLHVVRRFTKEFPNGDLGGLVRSTGTRD